MASWDGLRNRYLPISPVTNGHFAQRRKAEQKCCQGQTGRREETRRNKTFGFVEITDDYTIRMTNDSGIARLPIAQLSEADFQKYGFRKNRSKDGRFWYERKEALKSSQEGPKPKNNTKSESVAEIRSPKCGISALHRGLQKTLASKSEAVANSPGEESEISDVPFSPMFSEPGLGGPLPQAWPSLGRPAIQSAPGASGLRRRYDDRCLFESIPECAASRLSKPLSNCLRVWTHEFWSKIIAREGGEGPFSRPWLSLSDATLTHYRTPFPRGGDRSLARALVFRP